jgi:hypothetical protein
MGGWMDGEGWMRMAGWMDGEGWMRMVVEDGWMDG